MRKLTQREYQEMLQIGTVDVRNNTLFAKNVKVPIDKRHLTLVISSGGSGAAAIKEAIRTAEQKLEEKFSRYMKFILVDSVENEIDGAKKQMMSSNLRTFNISVDGVQERMEYNNRQAFFRTWVPKNYVMFHQCSPTNDRMMGKIKFYDTIEGSYVDVKFRQLIRGLYNGDWATFRNLPLDIMVITGLSGGTGSGTFLDLAAHARKACMEANVTGDIRVFGYLFLPDVLESFASNDLNTLERLYSNGYAALKELESYMDIPFNPERKEIFTSRDGVTNMVIDRNRPLFNYTALISGDYDETISMMSDFIINMELQKNGGFDPGSLYGNIGWIRNCYLSSSAHLHDGLLAKDFFPEDSHCYAGIGYAYACIPEKIITANIIGNVCRKMYEPDPMKPGDNTCFCTTEKRLSRAEMESIVRRLLSLNPNSKVTEGSFWYEKIKGILDQVSILSPNLCGITMDKKETAGKEAMKAHLMLIWHSFVNNAAVVMEEYGPRVMEFIYTGKGPDDKDGNPQYFPEISIKKMLEFAKGQLQAIVEDGKKGVEPSNNIPSGVGGALSKIILNKCKTDFLAAVQYQTKQAIAKGMIEM
ncbi:MAG: tubulin-like doman-containing protein, partial [Oliverpabstia sp.]